MMNALQLLAAALAATSTPCPSGQEINPDTKGQCCWPGQVWASSRRACVGVPVCPNTFVAKGESCSCPSGQVANADSKGNCCWPGQAWSASRGQCVGVPTQCPAGQFPNTESCAGTPETPPPPPPLVPPPVAAEPKLSCPAGQLLGPDTAGHCCWPGQVWSKLKNTCLGVPQCQPPLVADGETCSSCPAGQVSEVDMQGQCCWPGQVWSKLKSRCVGLPTRCPAGQAPEADSCVVPLEVDLPPPPMAQPEPESRPAPVTVVVEAPPREVPRAPRRTRLSITTGGLVGELTGAAIAVPIRIKLLTLPQLLNGTVALQVSPWVLLGGQRLQSATYTTGGAGVALAAGWHQRLGPVELFPHFGANVAGLYRTFAASWGVSVALKGLLGLTVAIPAGESKKFILGGQALLGGVALGHFYAGMEF